MEEKNKSKNSILTFFLVLVIISIIVMGFMLYKIYKNDNNKVNEVNKTNELQAQVNALNKNVSNLQGKLDKFITSKEENTVNITTNTTTKEFSESEIKETLQNYLNLDGAFAGSPESLLSELGFKIDYQNREEKDGYVSTDVLYSDYKEKILNYVTEEWNEKGLKFFTYFNVIDGYIWCSKGGASGRSHEVVNISPNGDGTYTANLNAIEMDGITKTPVTYNFAIAEYNGKCVISYFDTSLQIKY